MRSSTPVFFPFPLSRIGIHIDLTLNSHRHHSQPHCQSAKLVFHSNGFMSKWELTTVAGAQLEAAWPAQPAPRAARAGSGHDKPAQAMQGDTARPCQCWRASWDLEGNSGWTWERGSHSADSWSKDSWGSSSQDTLLLSPGDWGRGSCGPPPIASGSSRWSVDHVVTMDTVSPSPGSGGPFLPGRQEAALHALRQALGEGIFALWFTSCIKNVRKQRYMIHSSFSNSDAVFKTWQISEQLNNLQCHFFLPILVSHVNLVFWDFPSPIWFSRDL